MKKVICLLMIGLIFNSCQKFGSSYNTETPTATPIEDDLYATQEDVKKDSTEIKRLEAIEKEKWSTESKAWNEASSLDSYQAYTKYLELYPKGRHKKHAEKKQIDITVDYVMSNSHGSLPPLDKVNYSNSSKSSIYIKNRTQYVLNIFYSGNNSKKVEIAPGSSSKVVLPNGNYRVAASVVAYKVRDFAGNESLTGGDYEVEYYIQTSTSSSQSYR